VGVANAYTVGQGRHLKLTVTEGAATAEVIGFGWGERLPELAGARTVDLAFAPSRNDWMGESRVQLKLKGFRVP
jgi:single-stranded-DNA-specific exonuclease